MSSTARTVTVVLAALAVAIGGYLVLRPGENDDKTASTTTTTTTATTPTTTSSTKTEPTATTGVPVPETTRIALKDGAPVGGVAKIDVQKGDLIRLTVTSDAAGEIHVHGFGIEKEAAPGRPARFSFEADIEGRFEVESHETGTQIAEITVNP